MKTLSPFLIVFMWMIDKMESKGMALYTCLKGKTQVASYLPFLLKVTEYSKPFGVVY